MKDLIEFKKKLKWIVTFAILIIIVPVSLFTLKFWNFEISDNPSDWGIFGDFLGGTVGTILSVVAIMLSLVSVYFSFKSIEIIQRNEILKNRPFPYLAYSLTEELIKIEIQNHGSYPLRVQNIKITDGEKKEFSDFNTFLNDIPEVNSLDIKIGINTGPTHILISGGSKILLEILNKTQAGDVKQKANRILAKLKESKISFEYFDLVDKKFIHKQNLKFFGRY